MELPEVEETFEIIKQTWRSAVKKSIQGGSREIKLAPKLRKRRLRRSNSCDRGSFAELSSASSGSSVYADILNTGDHETLEPLFSNPALECLITVRCRLTRNHSKKGKFRDGVLEVSYRSIHFTSYDKVYAVTIPYVDILKVAHGNSNELKIELKEKIGKTIFLACNQSDVPQLVCQLCKTFDEESSTSGYVCERPTDPKWKEKQRFFFTRLSKVHENNLLKDWKQYLAYYGSGSTIVRTKGLQQLILRGIPNSLRRKSIYSSFLVMILISM